MTAERQLARLRARFEKKAHELATVGFMIRGTILQRFSRCGSPGCGCHEVPPRLHGPYWQWTSKSRGKTVTRNLTEEQLSRYREWMENAHRFDRIIDELQELSAQADAILRSQERPAAARKEQEKAPRRRARAKS